MRGCVVVFQFVPQAGFPQNILEFPQGDLVGHLSLAGAPVPWRIIGSGGFIQDLLAGLSPATKLGHLRLSACHKLCADSPYKHIQAARVVPVVTTLSPTKGRTCSGEVRFCQVLHWLGLL